MLHKYKLLKLSRIEDVGDITMPMPGENYILELCVVKQGLSADCDFCGDHYSGNSSRDVALQLPISQLLRYECQEASCKEILCSATTVKNHQKLLFSFSVLQWQHKFYMTNNLWFNISLHSIYVQVLPPPSQTIVGSWVICSAGFQIL